MSYQDAPADWPAIELREIRVFLTLAQELHFGRTADRLRLSTSHVSQTIRTLEARIGGQLLERSSRHVALTALGERFREQLEPAFAAVQDAVDAAQRDARGLTAQLRLGFTETTQGPVLSRLVRGFQDLHPGCEVTLHEVEAFDPYSRLRRGEVDVLCHYLPVAEADLIAG